VHKTVLNEWKLVVQLKYGLKKLSTGLEEKWYCVKSLTEALKFDLLEYQLPHFLHTDDRNGMAFQVETRHPFMDYRLIEYSLNLPEKYMINNGWQKWILRKAVNELPDSIKWRKDKKGFSTPEKKFYPMLDAAITDTYSFRTFNIKRFKELFQEYM
jgi:asparagine synthetase B (glutamine-hydrolysing)